MKFRLSVTFIALLLAGCEIPGLAPDPRIAQREADARAIGSACRHGVRNIEECYNLNEAASKAEIFTGWKDMDQYMRENKIEGIRASAPVVAGVVEDPKPSDSGKNKATETASDTPAKSAQRSSAK